MDSKIWRFLIQILISTLAVFFTSWILPGVEINQFTTAIVVALVLALLNAFLKPLLVILTIPVTILTLGFFLLVINAFIIQLAGHFVAGFKVKNFLWAFLFGIILSLVTSLLEHIAKKNSQE